MSGFAQYILSVGCAAIACAVAQSTIGKEGAVGTVMKTVTGLLLTFTILQPITNQEITWNDSILTEIGQRAEAVCEDGDAIRTSAFRDVIKQETEAYILDKADELQLHIEVEVAVSEDAVPIPDGVTIKGPASPYAKMQLLTVLTKDLGLKEENILWI